MPRVPVRPHERQVIAERQGGKPRQTRANLACPMSAARTAAERILSASAPGAGAPCVLLRFGELALKGRNRPTFVAALERNLRRAASSAGRLDIHRRGSSFLVFTADEALPAAVEVALDVPGLSVVQPALLVEPSAEAGARAAIELLRGQDGRSFAVRS